MATLVKEIADEENGDGVRQMACIVCKNLIVNKTNVSLSEFAQIHHNNLMFYSGSALSRLVGTVRLRVQAECQTGHHADACLAISARAVADCEFNLSDCSNRNPSWRVGRADK